MEQWQEFIKNYQHSMHLFNKALQMAKKVMKSDPKDFAPFEIEFFISTLLYRPVNVLETVSCRKDDNQWTVNVDNAFKLMESVVKIHGNYLKHDDYRSIVDICLLPLNPTTRAHALTCLTTVCRRSAEGAREMPRHIASLQKGSSCKTPLAILIGTICEYHPETAEDHVDDIWRTYLIMLERRRDTKTVTKAVLQGITGFMKHYGQNLPTNELQQFYSQLSSKYIMSHGEVCQKILEGYSGLFREWMANDQSLRDYLWQAVSNPKGSSYTKSVCQVYQIVGSVQKDNIMEILQSEVVPRTLSENVQVQLAAKRVLVELGQAELSVTEDTLALEYELRGGEISTHTADIISFYIESNLPECERLLQAAILFFENIKPNKRREIVIHGILRATPNIRTAAVVFLATETCYTNGDVSNLDRYLPLWKDMLEVVDESDEVILKYSKLVFEDFMYHFIAVLETFFETDNVEAVPEKLLTFLKLASHVLTFHSGGRQVSELCRGGLLLIVHLIDTYGACAQAVSVARGLATQLRAHSQPDWAPELTAVYQCIKVDRCRDEALLCECCLMMTTAPLDYVKDLDNLLLALQIIFSRPDAEYSTLIEALRNFDELLERHGEEIDKSRVGAIMQSIEKLRMRRDISGRDARILHRDVVMFVGKHGHRSGGGNTLDSWTGIGTNQGLVLEIMNTRDHVIYKVNVAKILQCALQLGVENVLEKLLAVACINFQNVRRDFRSNQTALCALIRELCASHSHTLCASRSHALALVLQLCEPSVCIPRFVHFIRSERSPGVRKALCWCVESLLADRDELPARALADHAFVMMGSQHPSTRAAGLDIAETLISVLKENNPLAISYLLETLVLIAQTKEADSQIVFGTASKIFMDKIELFTDESVKELLRKLLINLLIRDGKCMNAVSGTEMQNASVRMDVVDAKIYKDTVKMTLAFMKDLPSNTIEDTSKIPEDILCVYTESDCDFSKLLYVLAILRYDFELNMDVCRNVLCYNDFYLVNKLLNLKMERQYSRFELEAILNFLKEYGTVLLELQYKRTLEFVGGIVKTLTPDTIKMLHRNLTNSLSVFVPGKNVPQTMALSFDQWFSAQPVKEITECIHEDALQTEYSLDVYALKIMFYIRAKNGPVIVKCKENFKSWSKTLLKLYSNYVNMERDLKSKMSYLKDVLLVSLRFLTPMEIKQLILEGHNLKGMPNEDVGMRFCRFFIDVFVYFLVKKPLILLDDDMVTCCDLLDDILKCVVKKKCQEEMYENVLELVKKLWPIYEARSSFHQKYSVLVSLANLPKRRGWDSNPLQWAVNTITDNETAPVKKMRLIKVLPEAKEFDGARGRAADCVPARLGELATSLRECFTALLDALVPSTGGRTPLPLLNILMRLADGDETKGWWDDSIDGCMASLAASKDENIFNAMYSQCWSGSSLGVCRRMLTPFLRYSTSQFCEQVYSGVIRELLSRLRKPETSPGSYAYVKCLVNCINALSILEVAFAKISPVSLESPSSKLYSRLDVTNSWYLSRETCKRCYILRKNVTCSDEVSKHTKDIYRKFQCAIYKCMCAALCRQRPPASKPYEHILSEEAWQDLVDPEMELHLPLKPYWDKRSRRVPVSVCVTTAGSATSSASVLSRSHVCSRSLSDPLLLFDLIQSEPENDTVEIQRIQLQAGRLNELECSATLTAALGVVSGLPHVEWRGRVATALTNPALHRNTRWLLAQCVCNSAEELLAGGHALALRPSLLAVVAENVPFNQLHVDILETVYLWREESPPAVCLSHLNTAIKHLISSIMGNHGNKSVCNTLLDILRRLLDIYGPVLDINWGLFESYESRFDSSSHGKLCTSILQRLAERKIHIPQLMPALLLSLESKQYGGVETARLVGFSLAACPGDVIISLIPRLKTILKSNTNMQRYLDLLHYTQKECAEFCDEAIFRKITNLVPKIPGREKNKCLKIIASYIANVAQPTDAISDMFDTIGLRELLVGDHTVDAMAVVKAGVRFMGENVRRSLIALVTEFCTHSEDAVRSGALEVMFAAFQDKHSRSDTSEPLTKKRKISSSSIMELSRSEDVYTKQVVTCLGYGLTDHSEAIAKPLRTKMAEYLSSNMAVRFAECFLLTVYLPATSACVPHACARTVSDTVSAILDMLFSHLRDDDRFKLLKLSEEPLSVSAPADAKLRTMSKTCHSTLRSYASIYKRANIVLNQTNAAVNVQITVDSVLETILQFVRDDCDAAQSFFLEVMKCVFPRGDAGLQSDIVANVCGYMVILLSRPPADLTPLMVELCRLMVTAGFPLDGCREAVEKLMKVTLGTEGESPVRALHEDILLRGDDKQLFTLGLSKQNTSHDEIMDDGSREFSIDDMESVFGQLSNWDDLTLQQRESKRSSLPILWDTHQRFRQSLDCYRGKSGWFSKMVASYRRQDLENTMEWLREIDSWPRRYFTASAVTEAIGWRDGWLASGDDLQRGLRAGCLVEWASRLMLRAAYIETLQCSDDEKEDQRRLSRSHELAWCERANEMALSAHVLKCVKRNESYLTDSEKLPWLLQKLHAQRTMALEQNDSELLGQVLSVAENSTRVSSDMKEIEIVLSARHLVLMLSRDTNTLSHNKIEKIMKEIENEMRANSHYTEKERMCLKSIADIVISFYDDTWQEDIKAQNVNLCGISTIISLLSDFLLDGILSIYMDVLFHALDKYNGDILEDNTALRILDLCKLTLKYLDSFSLEILKENIRLFPTRILDRYDTVKSRLHQDEMENMEKYKKCLQLVCDPTHTLYLYCKELMSAAQKKDVRSCDGVFKRMKDKIFENPYAGDEYKSLTKYKQRLYSLQSDYTKAESVIKTIVPELKRESPQTLKISHLCPSLTSVDNVERDRCISRLLGLKNGVQLVKLYENVEVITNSANRPVVIAALLSDGSRRRYVHKSGDHMPLDAAAIRALRAIGAICGDGDSVVTYNVTPLCDDSGIMDFLENYEKLNSGLPDVLIKVVVTLLVTSLLLSLAPRAADSELILTSMGASLLHYRETCQQIPSYVLRSKIMEKSSSIQDFITKKKRFINTLSCLTIANWILGVGDRHRENTVYNSSDGSLCGLDWAANVLRFGRSTELPPARLTRSLLAVSGGGDVLEARLQSLMLTLRSSHRLLLAVVKVSFGRHYEGLDKKLPYIEKIISGRALSYEITRDAILETNVKHADKYMALFDKVFGDFVKREHYSVEEQITCLLRHCTDEYILSVTRCGWEPWI